MLFPELSPAQKRANFRTALKTGKLQQFPGSWSPLVSMAIEKEGFDGVYISGSVLSNDLGYPDIGLTSLTEVAQRGRVIARTTKLPSIIDIDTGFGEPMSATRTVQEMIEMGLSGCHIEDQVNPKRCGHLDGKEVTSQEEFVSKIRAAVAARRNPDFVIIARTDARAVMGLDDAVKRANAALAAGADMAFVEAAQTMEEVAAVPRLVNGSCLLNVVPGGKTPLFNLSEAQEMGYRLAILPGILLKTVIEHCDATLQALKETGMPVGPKSGANVADTFRRFGADEWNALRVKFQKQEEIDRG